MPPVIRPNLITHSPPPPLQVPGGPQQALYVTAKVGGVAQLLLELRFTPGVPGVDATFKSERLDMAPLAFDMLTGLLM
jgi:hypothetical protein